MGIATRLEEEATNRELTTSELVREIVTTSAATALVALVVAVMLLLAYFFRLAFLADFLSRSDLIGLLTGIGVQVGELAGLLGIEKQGGGTLKQLTSRLGITVVGAVAGYNRTDDSEQRGGNSLLSTAAMYCSCCCSSPSR